MLSILMTFFLSLSVSAHEGHDHGPGAVPLQKGGVMRSLETLNLELVYKDQTLRIYPFETAQASPGKLKPAAAAKYPVSATIEFPKTKPAKLELKVHGDYWEAPVAAKGAHRFTVLLNIEQGGHKDKVKWTIEPKN